MKIKLWAIIAEKDGKQHWCGGFTCHRIPHLFEHRWEARYVLERQAKRKEFRMRVVRVNVEVEQ